MANVMAILQEVDKCIRCNGCVVGCKRTWNMKAGDVGDHRVRPFQRMVVKSQKRTDMGPFVRFSCWHCPNPPCAGRCPFKAIKKEATGGVSVDFTKCKPNDPACKRQCVTDCQRGGYPKVGDGDNTNGTKAFKCTLCHGAAGATASGAWLPTRATQTEIDGVAEKAHQPTCVYTCPAKALTWDTRANVVTKIGTIRAAIIAAGKTPYVYGDGSMFWIGATPFAPPKADPFVEDHVTPMVSGVLSSPLTKAALVPTLVVGGLMAISARRSQNEKKVELAMEGEV